MLFTVFFLSLGTDFFIKFKFAVKLFIIIKENGRYLHAFVLRAAATHSAANKIRITHKSAYKFVTFFNKCQRDFRFS